MSAAQRIVLLSEIREGGTRTSTWETIRLSLYSSYNSQGRRWMPSEPREVAVDSMGEHADRSLEC